MKPSWILKNLKPANDFESLASYFGVGIVFDQMVPITSYADLERFFLQATLNLTNSRVTEGVLCWIKEYGHLLSPSKIRKFIKDGEPHNPAVLGGFIEFMRTQGLVTRPLSILDDYTLKMVSPISLFDGPRVIRPASYFKKFNILSPNFALNNEKFLRPKSFVMKNCLELRNRSLFGSVLNSDVASALTKHPNINAYTTAKVTGHHKANVFKNFLDIKEALATVS